jgi:predicted adenine nucleotide alpha hydrolase (AANH) superfamily ATPase
MNILLHVCCGPCSIFPTKWLTEQGKDFTLYFFNPNIHPYREFKRRLNTLMDYCQLRRYKLVIDKSYPLEETLRGMLSEPVVRCAYCYRVRLEQTAKYAKEHGFDAFSSTLLVSPYQKHGMIRETAEAMAEKYQIPFFYEDFRKGYQEGVDISLELGMYRQPYCGCIFSERDRFEKRKKKHHTIPEGEQNRDEGSAQVREG